MTDEEFNRYCAQVMGIPVKLAEAVDSHNPATDLNQMAEVFDKLMSKETFILMKFWTYKHPDTVQIPIAQAMREFIESTKGY